MIDESKNLRQRLDLLVEENERLKAEVAALKQPKPARTLRYTEDDKKTSE